MSYTVVMFRKIPDTARGGKLVKGVRLQFEWVGGPYIEVRQVAHDAGDVIHVWDYEKNESRIPFDRAHMRLAVLEWMREYGIERLRHDVTTHWPQTKWGPGRQAAREATRPRGRAASNYSNMVWGER